MYKHHEESLQILKDYFSEKEDTIAIIFCGSVARGNERPDSDLDAMIVVSEEVFEERLKNNRTAESLFGMCTYENGYFDVKYLTKEFLIQAAEKGSEPTRNSFDCARVIYSRDDEIESILNRIPVFQRQEKGDKMLSFYSNLMLNYGYFLKVCHAEGYMLLHVVDEVIYSVYRMILQENEILFPSNRRLEAAVAAVADKPEHIMEYAKELEDTLSVRAADDFVKCYLDWSKWEHPTDPHVAQSRYVEDYEQWWRNPRPLVNEW